MAAKILGSSAKAACIVGFLILCCGIGVTTCGVIWLAYGGYQGHGMWSGIPLLIAGFFGVMSMTRVYSIFLSYLILSVLTSIGCGIQAVTGGLELIHWSRFIGDLKCSVRRGACSCIGEEAIRIDDLDSCDKIPTINDLFITIIFFSICGALLCIGGAIAGCVGLATVPRSLPTTLPRKPKPNQTPSSTLTLEKNNIPLRDFEKPKDIEPRDDKVETYPLNSKPAYTDDRDYYKEKDRHEDGRRDDYYDRDRPYDDRRYDDRPYDEKRYDEKRDDRYRDDDRHRDDYSDRSYDRRSYDREYDRDYPRDYDRGYDRDYNRTPPPDDKTYL